MKIRELLSDESKWCQQDSAHDAKDEPVHMLSPDAVRWCLWGAVVKCYNNEWVASRTVETKLNEAAKKLGFGSYIDFNDSSKFEDVKKLVDELDV